MTLTIPSTSVEYVRCLVTADVTLGTQTVSMAFMAPDTEPSSGDWKVAAWSGSYVQALVGAGGVITLAAHTNYVVWVKISDPPVTVVRRAGPLATY